MTNREIDALIAEKVMGWTAPVCAMDASGGRSWGQHERGGPWTLTVYGNTFNSLTCDYDAEIIETITDEEFDRRYIWKSPDGEYVMAESHTYGDCPFLASTDPAASKQARDRMRELGWGYRMTSSIQNVSSFACRFLRVLRDDDYFATADTEEMAVALAILKALGVE